MLYARDNATNAVLNGRVYVFGGSPTGSSVLSSMEVYDPATNTWTAAASLATLFGAEQDPAYELMLTTATSPWKILLARLSLVSAYNLLLVLGAGAVLLIVIPAEILGMMVFGWLAPMAFLSALALLLSLWIGTSNAIAISYFLWMVQFITYQSIGAWIASPALGSFFRVYRDFWRNPMLLLALSLPLVLVALWSANRPIFRLTT